MDCRDTLVVQPTGSGQSLCFQFPPVHQNKKSVVITPTISLMQDQVNELERKGINSVYLGSAQLDKQAEMNAMDVNGKEKVIFVTPEWIAKVQNQAKLQVLAMADKLSLIAVDEAHLVSDWSDFRKAYSELEKLKIMFPDVPIMAHTATATPDVEGDIKTLLRNPLTVKASINRPNITLNAHEVKTHTVTFAIFAKYVADITSGESTIVYTDFIADVGAIVSSLNQVGIESVGYHGEMDPRDRMESYMKWKSGEVQIIVATKAFGMGINKANIRHVIRNGVPESIVAWTQELGRAGRGMVCKQLPQLFTEKLIFNMLMPGYGTI